MSEPVEFERAGREKGLQIWRIEQFKPVPILTSDYGKFFTGDSYIVLSTKEIKRKLTWDIHFWLGTETTQDEAGSAAYLTVKLDDRLNGRARQHREVQDHESDMFLGYFKGGIRYAEGGVETGFKTVKTNAAGGRRLFQVKGRKHVRVRQVDASVQSMNKGDCYILDTGKAILIYVGPKSRRIEKLKATSAATQIRDQDHRGRGTLEIMDEYSSHADQQRFFTELGSGSPAEVAEDQEDDEIVDLEEPPTLYVLKDVNGSGSFKSVAIGQSPLKQEILKSEECYILDAHTAIFVWTGRTASAEKRAKAMAMAQELISTHRYPQWTRVVREVPKGETAAFKQFFGNWQDKEATNIMRILHGYVQPPPEEDFDPAELHRVRHHGGAAPLFMPDNGEGDSVQYRIENFVLVAVDAAQLGIFYAGDSYVVKYETREASGKRGFVIYNWQGRDSTADERAGSAILAQNEQKKLGGHVPLVRVMQCNEPRHFLKIFHGTMIIMTGGHASGFKNLNDKHTYDSVGCRLFRVRGATGDDVRADQRPTKAVSLASDDAFVLESPLCTWIWHGRGASEVERLAAREVAARLAPHHDVSSSTFVDDETLTTRVLAEGEEPAEFWKTLGGKATYDTTLDPGGEVYSKARLFRCWASGSGASAVLKVQEVMKFDQGDLKMNMVMVLDGGDEVYIWIGRKAPEVAQKKAEAMAIKYIKTEPSERTEETVTFIRVEQGAEPRSFRRLFGWWDDDYWEEKPNKFMSLTRSKTFRNVKRAAGGAVTCTRGEPN